MSGDAWHQDLNGLLAFTSLPDAFEVDGFAEVVGPDG